jgi:hypothetical protein
MFHLMGRIHVEIMEPNPYLVASSVLFAIPTTVAAYNRHWSLYAVFLYISLISSIYHATKYQPLLYLDYPGVCMLCAVIGFENWKIGKMDHYFGMGSIIVILYWGGWFTGHLIFAENVLEKNISHAGMHILVSIGGVLSSYFITLSERLKDV